MFVLQVRCVGYAALKSKIDVLLMTRLDDLEVGWSGLSAENAGLRVRVSAHDRFIFGFLALLALILLQSVFDRLSRSPYTYEL